MAIVGLGSETDGLSDTISLDRLIKALGSQISLLLLFSNRYLCKRGVSGEFCMLFPFFKCISNVLFFIIYIET